MSTPPSSRSSFAARVSSGARASSSRPGELFALDDDDRVLRLAPTGTDPALLGVDFLRPSDVDEATALEKHLGVPRLTPAAFVRENLLRRLDAIPSRARNRAIALRAIRCQPKGRP